MKKSLILAGALLCSSPLMAAGPDKQVLIPKVDEDSIDDSSALDASNMIVHTKFGQYYSIFFATPCPSVLGKETPYFMPNPQGKFGKGDIVRYKKEKCTATSVMESGPPPPKTAPKG